jgi:hypothetical protein
LAWSVTVFTRQGWFWDTIRSLNDHFNEIGFAIVGVFILAWIASLAIYRYAPTDEFALVAERNSKASAKVSAT